MQGEGAFQNSVQECRGFRGDSPGGELGGSPSERKLEECSSMPPASSLRTPTRFPKAKQDSEWEGASWGQEQEGESKRVKPAPLAD